VIDRFAIQMGRIGYPTHRRTHIYVLELSAKSLKQSPPGLRRRRAAWSPTATIAFAVNRSKPTRRHYNKDIWTVAADNADKGAHPTQVTTNPREDSSPAMVSRRQWIAYSTQLDPSSFIRHQADRRGTRSVASEDPYAPS